jgi:hypothetical protein
MTLFPSITFKEMKVEPPKENDDRQYLTSQPGEFFELVYEKVLYLGGRETTLPAKTPVWIVLRANGRLLLQTADRWHRWASHDFLETLQTKKKNAS